MPEQTFSIRNCAQKIRINAEDIFGSGVDGSYGLTIPLNFETQPVVQGKKTRPFSVIGVDAKLSLSGNNFLIAQKSKIGFYRTSHSNSGFLYYIELPIDNLTLSKVEKYRKENLDMSLSLTIHVGLFSTIVENEDGYAVSYDFLSEFESIGVQNIPITIAQSTWVTKMLPKLGYDAISVIEIPSYSKLVNEHLQLSNDELKKAISYFTKGDYDKTVSHCRSALEPIREKMKEAKAAIESSAEKEWATGIINSTEEWLSTIVQKNYRLSNKAHHPSSFEHFTRNDAEVIYMITASIVSYVGNFDPIKYDQRRGH